MPATDPDSVLHGFFSTEAAKVRAALALLEAASHGEVRRPGLVDPLGRAERDGLCCPRIFGPFADDHCACGRVQGDRSLRGTSCPRCGVPIGPRSLRAERWAHVSLAQPFEHPAGIPVARLPVPPPDQRPLGRVQAPASGRLAPVEACVPGGDTRALQLLLTANQRLARLLEIGAPQVILDMQAGRVQAHLEAVVRLFALPPDHAARAPGSLWEEPEEPPPAPLLLRAPTAEDDEFHEAEEEDGPGPIAVAYVGPDRALVQWTTGLQLVALDTGAVLRERAPTGQLLRGTWRGHALFTDPYGQQLLDDTLEGLAVLDVEGWGWCTEAPADMPLVSVNKDQPEDAWLEDWRTGRTAAVYEDRSGDRAQELARSPDLQFVWISSSPEDGAIQSLVTAEPQLMVSQLRLDDQDLPGDAPPESDDDDDTCFPPAFARGPDGLWCLLDAARRLSIDGELRYRVPGDTCAGAFSADAQRLLLAGPDRIIELEVRTGAPRREQPLRPPS